MLDPLKYPLLRAFDIIVEMHDVFYPHISQCLLQKFTETHEVVIIENKLKVVDIPSDLQYLSEFEKMLLGFEMRLRPTPWAVMTVNEGKK